MTRTNPLDSQDGPYHVSQGAGWAAWNEACAAVWNLLRTMTVMPGCNSPRLLARNQRDRAEIFCIGRAACWPDWRSLLGARHPMPAPRAILGAQAPFRIYRLKSNGLSPLTSRQGAYSYNSGAGHADANERDATSTIVSKHTSDFFFWPQLVVMGPWAKAS